LEGLKGCSPPEGLHAADVSRHAIKLTPKGETAAEGLGAVTKLVRRVGEGLPDGKGAALSAVPPETCHGFLSRCSHRPNVRR